MFQQPLNAVLQRGRGTGTTGASTLHGQIDYTFAKTAILDVAAIARHCRAHPCFQQFLDLRDDVGVFGIVTHIFVFCRDSDAAGITTGKQRSF